MLRLCCLLLCVALFPLSAKADVLAYSNYEDYSAAARSFDYSFGNIHRSSTGFDFSVIHGDSSDVAVGGGVKKGTIISFLTGQVSASVNQDGSNFSMTANNANQAWLGFSYADPKDFAITDFGIRLSGKNGSNDGFLVTATYSLLDMQGKLLGETLSNQEWQGSHTDRTSNFFGFTADRYSYDDLGDLLGYWALTRLDIAVTDIHTNLTSTGGFESFQMTLGNGQPAEVPEPGTLMILGLAVVAAPFARRFRRR
ncbi:MAG: PEP-CTERM sorting domain-containing protein [Thermoguttaceae bacterium]